MNYLERIIDELNSSADLVKAEHHYGFFKAFPGGYGEGDSFLGVTVPAQRQIARKYHREISLPEVEKLLQDPYHERRLTALFILRLRFEKERPALSSGQKQRAGGRTITKEQTEITGLYLDNLCFVNNWDLVDSSAPYILGPYLYHGEDKTELYRLAGSGNLWKERTAVLATFYFIRQGRYRETLELAEKFLEHRHDLMHKAVGWMLREIGKRDFSTEFDFLKTHYHRMPRTMLRYAIEKFDHALRQQFLTGLV